MTVCLLLSLSATLWLLWDNHEVYRENEELRRFAREVAGLREKR